MQEIETQEDIHDLISKNAVVSVLANVFYLATRLILPPIILHYISLGEYGLWSYCFILISYISMGAFGVTNVYMRFIAIYAAQRQPEKINALISTGIAAVGFITLLLTPVIWFSLPTILTWFHVSDSLKDEAFYLLFGTTLIFFIDLILSVFSSTLQSLQQFTLERGIWIISIAAETLLILAFLMMGGGLFGLMWAYLIRVLLGVIFYILTCYHVLPTLSISPRHFDKKLLKLFYHFGGIIQLTGIISTINRTIEKVFAGLFLGPAATGLYEVGKKFPMTAIVVPSSLNAVLLPATAHLHAKEEHDKILGIYLQGSRWVHVITGLMMGFMAAFAFPLVTCWLGPNPKYHIAAVILACFSIACQMDTLTGPASAIYRSINRPLRELVYCTLQFFFVLMAAFFLFSVYGYSFTTINIAVVAMDIVSVLVYLYLCNRFFQVSHWTYFRQVLLPGLIPYLFGYGIYGIMHSWFQTAAESRWETFGLLCLAAGVYLFLLIPFFYYGLCKKEERSTIRKQLRQTLGELAGKK